MGPEKYRLELPLRTADVSGPSPTDGAEETELCAESRSEDSHVMPADWR